MPLILLMLTTYWGKTSSRRPAQTVRGVTSQEGVDGGIGVRGAGNKAGLEK